MNPNYLGALEKGGNMPSVDTLLEIGDVYGVNASGIVREVEEARRAARRERAAAVITVKSGHESGRKPEGTS